MGAKIYGASCVKMSGGRKLTYTPKFAETHDLRVVVPCGCYVTEYHLSWEEGEKGDDSNTIQTDTSRVIVETS